MTPTVGEQAFELRTDTPTSFPGVPRTASATDAGFVEAKTGSGGHAPLPVPRGHLELLADRSPHALGVVTISQRLRDRPAPETGDHVVTREGLGVRRAELLAHPVPEVGQAHLHRYSGPRFLSPPRGRLVA